MRTLTGCGVHLGENGALCPRCGWCFACEHLLIEMRVWRCWDGAIQPGGI